MDVTSDNINNETAIPGIHVQGPLCVTSFPPSGFRLSILLTPLVLSAQQQTITRLDATTISLAQIDSAVMRSMKAGHVTGVGIATWNGGKVAYLKTYGDRDTKTQLLEMAMLR